MNKNKKYSKILDFIQKKMYSYLHNIDKKKLEEKL